MKVLLIVGLVLAAFLQAEARSIGALSQEIPKVLKETMEQSFSCALKLGPKVANVPKLQGIQQLPEDNESLNQLFGCIFVKKALINEEGDVNADNLRAYLVELFSIFGEAPDELLTVANELTEECKDVKGDDYGKTSVKIQNCINAYTAKNFQKE